MERILIVDDSVMARSIIRRSLEICGLEEAEIREVANGKEALELLKHQTFDLVITDLNMPVMGGEELLKRMKSSPRLFEIPVAVVSSLGNSVKKNKLIQQYATAVFQKPISLPEIQNFIDQFRR